MLLANKLHNISCFRYHKGTDFQANHNKAYTFTIITHVVLDTTKVMIFSNTIEKHTDEGEKEGV